MARLVEDLRTISLAEVGALELRVEPTDIVAVVHEVAATYRSSAAAGGLSIEVEAPASLEAAADPSALRRVLGNLVTNAIRHAGDGGRLLMRVTSSAGGVAIEVADSGAGMSAELVARAFERFEKGPGSDGSGLGLPIARDLVEAQGGSISLSSEPDAGTRVVIELGRPQTET